MREPSPIADGLWVVRGGTRGSMSVFLLRDGDGVTVFDAGVRGMAGAVRAAGAALGGIKRVVLGHAHADHRGTAPFLGAPVFCHEDEVAYAHSETGEDYFDCSKLGFPARLVMPRLLRHWDGGPVEIAGVVHEGDDIAGFRVVHLPGHSPGLITLFREADGLALTSDAFYVIDPQTSLKTRPSLPHAAFNRDEQEARASLRKLAALDARVAWPGHAGPLTGDVRRQLEAAADA